MSAVARSMIARLNFRGNGPARLRPRPGSLARATLVLLPSAIATECRLWSVYTLVRLPADRGLLIARAGDGWDDVVVKRSTAITRLRVPTA